MGLISVYRSRILKSTLLLGNLTSFCSCFVVYFFLFSWFYFVVFGQIFVVIFYASHFVSSRLALSEFFFASFCLLITCVCELVCVCVCYGLFYVYCVWNMFGIKVGPFPGIKSFITAHRIRELWFQCLMQHTHIHTMSHSLTGGQVFRPLRADL